MPLVPIRFGALGATPLRQLSGRRGCAMEGLLTSSAGAKLAGCEVKPSLQSIPPDVDVMLGNNQQPSPVCSLSRQIMYYRHGRTPLYLGSRGRVHVGDKRNTEESKSH